MSLLLKSEIVALFVLPILMALLRRRGVNIEKPTAFALATLLSVLVGTIWLYELNPETLSSLTFKDWLSAIVFALLVWAFMYPLCRWLGKQMF